MILYDSPYYGVTAIGDSVSHSGTKGMKWGIRRYQNEDGSYTPLGREHYGIGKPREKGKRTTAHIQEEYNARVKQWQKEHPAPAKPSDPSKRSEYQKAMKKWLKEQSEDPKLVQLAAEHHAVDRHEKVVNVSDYMKSNFKYKEFDKLMSHDEVAKQKKGSCHDQVMYAYEELKKQGLRPKATFLIEYNPKTNQGGMTHSFVYIKNKDGSVDYLENAWGGHEGVRHFENEKGLKQYFKDTHSTNEFGDSKKFPNFEMKNFKPEDHKPGEDLQEFVDKCLSSRR